MLVIPYLRQCGPPAFVETLPPMDDTIWLDGSGAKNQPRASTAFVSERLMSPGWTVAQRFGRSTSRIRFIRLSPTITPPDGAMAPPMSPVPEPRGTMGTSASRQSRTIATTSAVVDGSATASGAPL